MSDMVNPSVEQIHAALGRCVLLYQYIENCLKVVLPNLVRNDGTMCDDPLVEMQSLLVSKTTLGPLVERLKKSFEVAHPGRFHDYLETVVADRNELIHGFIKQPFGKLENEESRKVAMNYLNVKHAFALPLFELLRQVLASLEEQADDLDTERTRRH